MSILICGYRRHGKDFLYSILKDIKDLHKYYNVYVRNPYHYNLMVKLVTSDKPLRRVSFADKLKEEVAKNLNITVDNLEKWKDDKCKCDKNTPDSVIYHTYRTHLIELGRVMRYNDPLHWVKKAVDSHDPDTIAVVTDFRFPNEIEFGNIVGGECITIRVHRPSVPIPPYHESENSLDNFDVDMICISKEHGNVDIPFKSEDYILIEE